MRLFSVVSLGLVSFLWLGCGDDPTPVPVTLAIVGEYADPYGTQHQISSTQWEQRFGDDVSLYRIESFDNAQHRVIAQNDAANAYFPSLWSRFDWLERDGVLWFCQIQYQADSAEAAQATSAPDAADPEASGCGMGSWSRLDPQ